MRSFVLMTGVFKAALLFGVAGISSGALAQGAGVLKPWPADPAAGIPGPWKAQYHPDIAAQTQFKLLKQGNQTVLQAEADMAYGSLVYAFAKPTVLNTLTWQWQILTQPTKANLQTKAGDDAGAKVCAFIQIDEGKLGLGTRLALAAARTVSGERLPAATLCYVWGSPGEKVGQVFDNPYTDRVRNIVVRDAASAAELISERRDLQADARKAFGKELPEGPVMFTGIALGADSDNTQSKAKALFGSVQAQP
ncbi:MAG: DUF3047 domain-containing protein [Limnobacter sp.]|jgi:hypothetical protein|uniref:DUF3047 domain-containing protein n=1 Tax=Limnobacter profundi TaxID=2732163 RepID=A0ABX6N9S9_9BURK|nr:MULTISPECIES: DUF3047 domain-containing protein [unclassified Limnobacter]MBA4316738.1 hypothetical protein [Alcaligenaceae bacterium]MDP3272432.1 DUF3047 domain-containing protein [Limnobacter sp.]MDZ4050173.1 DUF3047 domain-containing protein [Limnobacter sp.]QJR30347.1 DUF3047 domain-containing protein [Limnobacter sp. SAORIC-580]RZO91734.1 MAG: DUF3047 domain-containing protein [Limnobacter sp.]